MMDGFLAVAFPTDCVLCGQELSSIGLLRVCRICWDSLQAWQGPVCVRCGLPFASEHALDSAVAQCGACREAEPAFDAARSFGLYVGKLRQVILRAKFGSDERLSRHLGRLLAPAWQALPQVEDLDSPLLVPVPLHSSRQRERGFNQSALLAAGLAGELGRENGGHDLAILAGCLRRHRATRPQTGLSVAARRENLRGAFEVAKPEQVRRRAIVLVDDVMTTGATISACARVLRRAGAACVLGITLARATPQFPDLLSSDDDPGVDGHGRDST